MASGRDLVGVFSIQYNVFTTADNGHRVENPNMILYRSFHMK